MNGRLDSIPPVLFVVAAALMWSTIGTSYRLILDRFDTVDSVSLVTIRALAATLMLGLWIAWQRPDALRPPRDGLPYFALLGGSAITGFYVIYGYALEWSNVAVSTVLLYLAPAIVGAGGALFLNERLGKRHIVSTLLAFAGCILVVGVLGGDHQVTTKGVVAGLISAVLYASFTLLGKPIMGRYRIETTLFYHLVFGSAGLVVVAYAINGGIHAPWTAVLVIGLFNGIFNTLLPVASYTIGMRRMRAGSASTIATIEPVIAIGLAWVLLGESLGFIQLVGAALVVLAVVMLARGG